MWCMLLVKPKRKCFQKIEQETETRKVSHTYIDIETVKDIKTYLWLLINLTGTGHKTWRFYDNKNYQIAPMCVQINKWKDAVIPVKYVRCDNVLENKSLQKLSENSNWKLRIDLIKLPMIPHIWIIWLKWVLQLFLTGEDL